jgi:predicted SAM-dependent methyltransferase
MRSQFVKNLYYCSVGKLSALSYAWHRLSRPARFADAFLNLGCGPKYVEGMVNADGNILCKKDLWLDVRIGLPFPCDSLQGIYASHMIEHLGIKNVRRLFAECHRVLKPGGAVRLVVPSLEYAIRSYQGGRREDFPVWPEEYKSLGGRFNNLMLCANQHLVMFDFGLLEELLRQSGFRTITRESSQKSRSFSKDHLQFESDSSLVDVSLYVEATK